jgi:hypothetical protein
MSQETLTYSDLPWYREQNQLRREFLDTCGLNPFIGAISSSRVQMFASHIGQYLIIKGMTERRIQTGMEREFGKYTFSVKMPHQGRILKKIERYQRTNDVDSIKINPQTVVLYEREDNNEIGMINLTNYCSQHQYFGFDYVKKKPYSRLRRGEEIKKGEIFLDSPAVTENGNYCFGRELNIAYLSHEAVAEDGIMICEDVLPELRFKTYEVRSASFGLNNFPLNLMGTDEVFKAFPDIGEEVRPDGLLLALRDYDLDLALVEQSAYGLRKINYVFDDLVYAAGPGGRIKDIRVWHENRSNTVGLPVGMDTQLLKYDKGRREFYQGILDELRRIRRERHGKLNITRELHRMEVEAISVVGHNTMAERDPIKKNYRKEALDDWRIEFVIEYEITPNIGFKLTDTAGGGIVKVRSSL